MEPRTTPRGIRKIEYRTRPTKKIGEAFHIHAARKPGPAQSKPFVGAAD